MTQAVHARPGSRLPLTVCLTSALLPFLAVQASYLLAAQHGSVPWCFPYIDSCTSISATGREGPAAYLFRGAMLPASAFIAMFWWLHWRWLTDSGVAGRSRAPRRMAVLGWLACLGLVLYVAVLGESGDLWRLQRRIGTVLFFSFTFLAQLLLATQLRFTPASVNAAAEGIGRWMLRLCVLMLFIGIFSVIVQALDETWHDAIEDAVEWQLALLLQINFLLCAFLWRGSAWRLAFQCAAARDRDT